MLEGNIIKSTDILPGDELVIAKGRSLIYAKIIAIPGKDRINHKYSMTMGGDVKKRTGGYHFDKDITAHDRIEYRDLKWSTSYLVKREPGYEEDKRRDQARRGRKSQTS